MQCNMFGSMEKTEGNNTQLERDTAAYFEKLSTTAAREEARLEAALDQKTCEIDFDS